MSTRQEMLQKRITASLRRLFRDGYTLGEIAWALYRVARDWGKAARGDL